VLVSVITAVYNGEPFLKEAIDSILSQTYKNIEYIIVNDGSTDGTAEILNSITDTRVKIIHLEKNQGAAKCLNLGIDQSRGDLIAIQDADDISEPTRFEEQVSYLGKHKEFVGVASFIKSIEGKYPVPVERILGEEGLANFHTNPEDIFGSRFYSCTLVHGSVLYYRDIFYKVGKYNPQFRIAYDYDLWLKMFELGKIAKIPKVLYKWRVNTDSLFRSNFYSTCNEVQRASTTAIYRELQKVTQAPVIGVYGTSKACNNFHDQVTNYYRYNIRYYSDKSNKTNNILKDYKNNYIHGVIILDKFSPKSDLVFNKLAMSGLEPNKSLFKMWNIVN
jgi:glycosyltransferase involved in cell wall biosynthesis